jgi:hypothetical protein
LHRFCETGFDSRCRRAIPALNDRFHIHLATNSTCLLEQPNDTLARLMTDTTRSISTADLSHQRGLRLDRFFGSEDHAPSETKHASFRTQSNLRQLDWDR